MESKGEILIRKILQKEGYFFKQEYSFPQLKSYKGAPLRFDFAVFNGSKPAALIEWQGEQHYHYVEHFTKNKINWKYARERDLQKARFALLNGIPLYCIPYSDYDKIHTSKDIFSDMYLIKNKWDIYKEHQAKT